MGAQTWEAINEVDDVLSLGDFACESSSALQSQYSHAQRFKRLGQTMRDEIDATNDLEATKVKIADMKTAEGQFLDWWGERIGVSRILKVVDRYHRFDDETYRFLLEYRAVCNISNATASTMNKMLTRLTSERVFVVDYQNMTIQSIVVIGSISELQATILQTYGLLNRPAGVLTNFLIIYPDEKIFGFEGQALQPFDHGVLNPGRTIGQKPTIQLNPV